MGTTLAGLLDLVDADVREADAAGSFPAPHTPRSRAGCPRAECPGGRGAGSRARCCRSGAAGGSPRSERRAPPAGPRRGDSRPSSQRRSLREWARARRRSWPRSLRRCTRWAVSIRPTPAATASLTKSTWRGVCVSLFVPSPIRATSVSPTRTFWPARCSFIGDFILPFCRIPRPSLGHPRSPRCHRRRPRGWRDGS